jgi:hypothetical protein
MIVVRVELWSAITGVKTELARLHICNDGSSAGRRRNYVGESFRGRDKAALDQRIVSHRGAVREWPSPDRHVWRLVAAMLSAMGYAP